MNNVGKYSNPYISERLGEGMSCRSLYATLNASRPRKTQDSLTPPPSRRKTYPRKEAKQNPERPHYGPQPRQNQPFATILGTS